MRDPKTSRVYAPKDSKFLLLSLQFDPENRIKNRDRIGWSLMQPRRLSEHDVRNREDWQKEVDRWSVFISYRREDEEIAKNLSEALAGHDVAVYSDKEGLKPGDNWWQIFKRQSQDLNF